MLLNGETVEMWCSKVLVVACGAEWSIFLVVHLVGIGRVSGGGSG